MWFKPRALGAQELSDEALKKDRKECRRFGPAGVGEKALYLNDFFLEMRGYVVIGEVRRVYKRIAMSRGGFTGRGAFGAIPYLVVEYGDGKEKACNFKREEYVDGMIALIHSRWPSIPVHSEQAERRLKEKEERLAAKAKKLRDAKAREDIERLSEASAFLEKHMDLCEQLSFCARRKRTYDRSNPAYKWVALAIVLLGAASVAYGIFSLVTRVGFGLYFTLFGLAAIFFFAGANVLPTAKNNRTYIEGELKRALEEMEACLKDRPGFPVPARYAHPFVLKRMQEVYADERAADDAAALEEVKKDLKALNSDVEVEQEEYDEIIAIKPMFLVNDYR